ncbi:MAG: hypothetical protein MJZ74_03540 [Muribaculaceae bacterium]|nr:hypothetical protein [Muribaculaceae bacterium]
MKPTKNHIYCPASHKPKILFKTQKKADNFIKFNSEEILDETGVAPVRSYYCMVCGGWHVTSNPSKEEGERLNQRDQRATRRLRTQAETEQLMKDNLKEITEMQPQFNQHLLKWELSEAHECFRLARHKIILMRAVGAYATKNKITQILAKAIKLCDNMYFLQRSHCHVERLSADDIERIMAKKERNSWEESMVQSIETVREFRLHNSLVYGDLPRLYNHLQLAVTMAQFDKALSILDQCRDIVSDMAQQGASENDLNSALTTIKSREYMIDTLQDVYNSPSNSLGKVYGTTPELNSWRKIRDNYPLIKKINSRIATLEHIQDPQELENELAACRKLVKGIKGATKEFRNHYYELLDAMSTTPPSATEATKSIEPVQEPATTGPDIPAAPDNEPQHAKDKRIKLQILNMLERMQQTYAEGKLAACKSNYDGCCYLMSVIDEVDDEYTRAIEAHLEAWEARLGLNQTDLFESFSEYTQFRSMPSCGQS